MFYKFIRYDLMYGLLYRWRAYALTFLLFTLSCSPMISLHHRASQTFVNLPSFTYGDHILYLFAGMNPSSGERFFLPTLWIFVILLFLYLTLAFTGGSLNAFGQLAVHFFILWYLSRRRCCSPISRVQKVALPSANFFHLFFHLQQIVCMRIRGICFLFLLRCPLFLCYWGC